MYAIAKCGGKQFRLEPRAMVRVPVLETPVGGKVRIEEILFLSDGSKVEIGRPLVEGAYAEAVVVRHGRHRKVRIIKYKRRKSYRRTIGHRQGFTELEIGEIVLGGKKKAAAPAKEKEAAPVEETGLPVAAAQALEAEKPAQVVSEIAAEPKRKRAVKAEAAPKSAKESAEKAKAEAKPKRAVKAPAKGKAAAEKPAAKPAAKAGAKKKASDKSEGAGEKTAAARKKKAEKEKPKTES